MKGKEGERRRAQLWPAGTVLHPALLLHFPTLGSSLFSGFESSLLLRYHVRLACAYRAF